MKNTKVTFLIVTILMILSVAGYFYGLSYVSSLADKTILKKQDIEVAQVKLKHLSNLDKTSKENADKKSKLKDVVLGADKTIEFVSSIEKVAEDMNLDYRTNSIDLKQSDQLSQQNKELLQVVFSVNGTWRNVVNFIKYIETMPRIIKFEGVKLVASDRTVNDLDINSRAGVSLANSSNQSPSAISSSSTVTGATSSATVSTSTRKTAPVSVTQVAPTRSNIWNANITFFVVKEKDK